VRIETELAKGAPLAASRTSQRGCGPLLTPDLP
jgi:hypothetical protein